MLFGVINDVEGNNVLVGSYTGLKRPNHRFFHILGANNLHNFFEGFRAKHVYQYFGIIKLVLEVVVNLALLLHI